MAALMRSLVLLLVVVAPLARGNEDASIATQRIKAAFLYKFAAYVQWPAGAFTEAGSPIVIGIAGADPMARELAQAVAGRKVGTRPMQVHRLGRADGTVECCQILFIGSGSIRAAELLSHARGRPVLTVTEEEAEHPKGSVINFLVVEDRVRFDIARDAAERNRLQLRSQLLGVARQVSAQ
jgi:hypothetical protein